MKNSDIKLSVLIPTYNRESYISQAIDSVLNQPFQDFEIICSDNASTDSTFNILQQYASNDNRIKIYQSSENLGPVPNWKVCLDNSRGEYIHWLWSDDWIENNFYRDAFNLIENKNAKIITCWNYRVNRDDINGKYISWRFSHHTVPGIIAAKKILTQTKELPVSPAAYILPRKLVIKHFYTTIPNFKYLKPVESGVGVDALMIVGSCMETNIVHVIRKPSVNFRKHDNISAVLNKNRSLGKMYFISFFWFLSKNSIQLDIRGILWLLIRLIYTYRSKGIKILSKNKSVIYSFKHFFLLFKNDKFSSKKMRTK